MRLFLAGDVMIGRGVDQALEPSVDPALHERWVRDAGRYLELAERAHGPVPRPLPPAYPWGDALELLSRIEPDARIVNLETALTAGGRPWEGKGIHYRAHPAHTRVLDAAGIDVCSLANNHVLDWGRSGLSDTLEALSEAGIGSCGAGGDRTAAASPAEIDAGDGRVRVFGLASPASGVPDAWAARDDRAGVWLLPELSAGAAERVADRVGGGADGETTVVSIHWGGNWGYGVPPRQRRFARRLLETGAVDVIHGHSSHHPRGIEIHRGRPVLYGCGDLINDYGGISGHEEFRPGLVLLWLVELDGGGRLGRLEMIPLRLRRLRLERASGEEARWLAETLDRESRDFGTRVDLEPGPVLTARPV